MHSRRTAPRGGVLQREMEIRSNRTDAKEARTRSGSVSVEERITRNETARKNEWNENDRIEYGIDRRVYLERSDEEREM